MSTFNFRKEKCRFTKNIIVNPLNSVALGLLNLEHVVSGLPVAGSTTGETFALEMCMRGIGVRLTANGEFAIKFPETLRTKPLIGADGVQVIDPTTGRGARVPDLTEDGQEQWDADYFPITKVTREAFKKFALTIPGVAEAIVEGRNALAAKLGQPALDAGTQNAPAPQEEFSV